MDGPVHIAITRRVRKEHVGEFEQALAEFARRSLAEPGRAACIAYTLRPALARRNMACCARFASAEDRDAFYASPLYRDWIAQIKPWIEGDPQCRDLQGLEAWFREPGLPMPPDWKMALLTWIAVWPVSMLVPAVLLPLLGPKFNFVLAAGIIAAGIVVILTWVAMPILVKIAYRWLYPTAL